jgi:ABC-type lipoprotein release transport system permease subunit
MIKSKKASMGGFNFQGIVGGIIGLLVGLVIALILYSVVIPIMEDSIASVYGNSTTSMKVLYAPTGILPIMIELLPFITTLAMIFVGYKIGQSKAR